MVAERSRNSFRFFFRVERHDIRRGQARGRTDPGPGIGGPNAAAVERPRQLWTA